MFLVDTNIFLEILLKQDKRKKCRNFLDDNLGSLHVTDFSLHSIGVILFKYNKELIFNKFIEDFMSNTILLSLPVKLYKELINAIKYLNLDFDDAYQYKTAQYYALKIVTMDKHFEKIKDVDVLFM